MKYSIIIPYYDPEYRKTHLLTECIKSVVLNSQGQDYELVIVKDGPSYTESHNMGLQAAKGDYLVIINDDIVICDHQWLEKLTFDDGIAAWTVGNWHGKPMPNAWCFAMSRAWYQKLGGFDEIYKDGINYEDTDYFLRAQEMGAQIKNADFRIETKGEGTWQTYFKHNKTDLVVKNMIIFRERWEKE